LLLVVLGRVARRAFQGSVEGGFSRIQKNRLQPGHVV
jgi:hypothetical protein